MSELTPQTDFPCLLTQNPGSLSSHFHPKVKPLHMHNWVPAKQGRTGAWQRVIANLPHTAPGSFRALRPLTKGSTGGMWGVATFPPAPGAYLSGRCKQEREVKEPWLAGSQAKDVKQETGRGATQHQPQQGRCQGRE